MADSTKGSQPVKPAVQNKQPAEKAAVNAPADPVVAPQGEASPESVAAAQKDWREILYTEERVTKWAMGEMTLAELDGISGPEMLEMAITGYAMFEQGRFRESKIIFDGLAALDPSEAYFRTALGTVFLAQDQLDEAIAQFDHALKLNVKDTAAYVNRGEARLRKGMLIEAAEDFKSAIDLDPEQKDPMTMRARALATAAIETLEARGITENASPDQIEAALKTQPQGQPAMPAAPGAAAKAAAAKPAAKPAAEAKKPVPAKPEAAAKKPVAKHPKK